MIPNLKALGLALLATAAISVVLAGSASGESITSQQFTAEQYPAWIHGENAVGSEHIVLEAGSITCTVTYTGTISGPTKTLTLHETMDGCSAFGFVSASVSTEGCDFVYHLTTTRSDLTGTHAYQAHVDLVCESGKSIKIVAATCKAEIKSQSGLTTADFHSMSPLASASKKDLTFEPTLEGIAYTVTEDGFLCPFGGSGAKTGGTYIGTEKTTLKGYVDSGPGKGGEIHLDIG